MKRIYAYWRLMRLHKPIGTLLLLWPTLWALWIAGHGHPSFVNVLVFVLGTLLMRSAGCVMNDLADRHIDPHVARTRERPLATGEVSIKEALLLAMALCATALALVLTRNPLTIALSVPALLLAGSYPFTKRFFPIPQAYLGIAFGFGIPMAFAAETNALSLTAALLLLANVFWAMAYDTEYAMVDRNDDIPLGVRSSAILFGRFDVWAIMLCYGFFFFLLMWVGRIEGLGTYYCTGLLVAGLMALYHYTLIRHRERAQCFKAFMHNNWLGAAVFAGLVADYVLRTNT
jgi:4-hydroxybenzoate polyprenyltransferase